MSDNSKIVGQSEFYFQCLTSGALMEAMDMIRENLQSCIMSEGSPKYSAKDINKLAAKHGLDKRIMLIKED